MSRVRFRDNETISPQRRLIELLSPEKKDLWIIVAYGVCSGVFALVIPIAVQTLVNTIAFGSMLQPILVLTFLVLLILGCAALLRGLQVFLMEIVQQRMFARTSLKLVDHIPRIKIQAFEGNHGPELINRFFDVLTVQKSTALIVIDGLSILLQTMVGMVLLAFYHPILLAFDLLLVTLIFGLVFFLGRGAIETSILESKKKYEVAGWLEELARLPVLFKHPKSKDFVLEHSDKLIAKYLTCRKAHFRVLLRQIVGALSLQVIASSLLLGLGGWLVVKRQLTLGQLVAAELVVTSVVTGVGKFGKYLESYYDLVAAADKLGYLMELPVEELDDLRVVKETSGARTLPSSSLSMVDVHYSYPDQEPCLKGLQLTIQAGEKIAIYGKRGSGKTTLCDLLYRLKEPHAGSVEIGNISAKDLPLAVFRSEMSFLKEADLFDGSLLENIQVHHKTVQVQDIYTTLERLGNLGEMKRLPESLMTRISGGRSPLSSSQAKLITLARALLAKPKWLLLDNFLDDLDDESRASAMQILLGQESVGVVMTTGSLMLAHMTQKYFVLEGGKLSLEQGSHR